MQSPLQRAQWLIALCTALALLFLGLIFQGSDGQEPANTSPSGLPMPGDEPGWKRNFADDFLGSNVDESRWTLYDGWSKSQPPSLWRPGQLSVGDGALTISAASDGAEWLTGGLSSAIAGAQRFGRWDIRFRVDPGDGDSYAILLYPQGGEWPPEIDIAEDAGGTRGATTSTLHYGANNTQVPRKVAADFTQWQTIGVEWSPGLLDFTLNGQVYGTIKGSAVPTVPMWLGMQMGKKSCNDKYANCPFGNSLQSVRMQIDWVVRYEHN